MITCTQRIVIPIKSRRHDADPVVYPNYLAEFTTTGFVGKHFSLRVPSEVTFVSELSPRTVNTTITAAASNSGVSNQTSSHQTTSGSSTSETNTLFLYRGRLDYGHSSTSEQSRRRLAEAKQSSSATRRERTP